MHKFPVERAGILDSAERASILNPECILDSAEIRKDSVIVDVGSGTGFFAIPASKRVPKGMVYAVDINQGMHSILEKKLRLEKIDNVATVISTEQKIPLADSEADFAYLGNTLHELEGELTLREILRILKPGGLLYALDWKKEESPMGPPLSERLPLNEAKIKIESAGFIVTASGEHGPYNYIISAAKSLEV